jgi:predicted nucleic acid-binding protein
VNKKILVDSDAFISLFTPSDSNHTRSKKIQKSLSNTTHQFYISSFVFSESTTVISQKQGRKQATKFIKHFNLFKRKSNYIYIDQEIENLAINIFKKQSSKNVSFVDCTNMAIYQKYKLDAIFSFDKHYKKNGINTL